MCVCVCVMFTAVEEGVFTTLPPSCSVPLRLRPFSLCFRSSVPLCLVSLSLSLLSPLSLYFSLILLRHSPHPPSPCFRFFAPSRSFFYVILSSSFLCLGVALPVFFSVPSEDRLTDKWPSPEGGGGGVSELDMFLFSLSSVCVSVLARVLSFPAACCCRLARNDTNRLFQVCG